MLKSRLLEFWAMYQTGSQEMIRTQLALEDMYKDERPFMLRIAGPDNGTRFLTYPRDWNSFPFQALENRRPVREGEMSTFRNPDDGRVLVLSSLFLSDGNILQVGISTTERERTLARFRNAFLLILVPLAAVGFLAGLFLTSRFLRPINKLTATMNDIIFTGEVDRRLPEEPRTDELSGLVVLFNRMLGRIEGLISDMRENLDNVAHDLITPLTRLRGAAEAALRSGNTPSLTGALRAGIEESDRILALLRTLLEISRTEAGIVHLTREHIDLAPLLDDLAELFSYAAQEKRIRFEKAIQTPLPAHVDANRIRQAVSNLLDNALKYTPPDRPVLIAARSDGGRIVIDIEDSGRGIPPEDVPRIFERFYRASNKDSDGGFGVGLHLAKAIVEAHHGSLSVRSRPGKGSVFTVTLPQD